MHVPCACPKTTNRFGTNPSPSRKSKGNLMTAKRPRQAGLKPRGVRKCLAQFAVLDHLFQDARQCGFILLKEVLEPHGHATTVAAWVFPHLFICWHLVREMPKLGE